MRRLLVWLAPIIVLVALALTYSSTSADQPSRPSSIPNSAFMPVMLAPAATVPATTVPSPTTLTILDPAPVPSLPARPAPPMPAGKVLVVVKPTPKPAPKPRPKATLPPVPSVADARAYARARIGSPQFSCLDALFEHESSWNTFARNPSSGAYGIPQALPGSKMGSIASDWRYNPLTQVKWGLSYIAAAYGTACAAWSHSQNFGWY
jgi:hypothetical protein